MFIKVLRIGAMVMAFSLLMGCLTACPRQIYFEEHITIEDLESRRDDLESQIESLNAKETSPPTTESKQPTPTPTPTPTPATDYDLIVWSFTDEMMTLAIAFSDTHPDVSIQYVNISLTDNAYQDSVIDASNNDDCPDVIAIESSFIKQFVDSDMLLDLSDLKPYADDLKTYANTIEMGTNFETGEIRAYSYQNTPGTVFYRRSLAEDYFGTDDPSEIQKLMSDMDKFTDMAQTVKEKSGGKTFMVASYVEFSNAIFANRKQPWVVNDTLVIDPIVDEYFDIAKVFSDNEYEAKLDRWTEGWFAGMSDSLIDANGEPVQIFCYFLPTWGLPYVLINNAPDTSGDWACCPGPLPYQWGGTWLGVMKNSAIPDLAKEFVRFCTLDEQNLADWATGVYTNEYLEAIYTDLAGDKYYDTLEQRPGDFVSSQKVVEAIAPEFENSEMSEFLGGQNQYSAFAEAAQNGNAYMFQEYDEAIQRELALAVKLYTSGELTKKEALSSFKQTAKYLY